MMSNKEVVTELLKIKDQVSKLGHKYISGLELPIAIDKMIEELQPFVNIEKSIQAEIQITFKNGRARAKNDK